jgi:hypothetical protein
MRSGTRASARAGIRLTSSDPSWIGSNRKRSELDREQSEMIGAESGTIGNSSSFGLVEIQSVDSSKNNQGNRSELNIDIDRESDEKH